MIIHSSNESAISTADDSLRKWGIPLHEAHESAEVVLLQRLVWVRYKSHWWPALLYHSYAELQEQVTDRMDTALKAQFAMAIMRQMQNKRSIKVARLLGKSSLEVVEVKVGSSSPSLPKRRRACPQMATPTGIFRLCSQRSDYGF
jgi:hypothetical protein